MKLTRPLILVLVLIAAYGSRARAQAPASDRKAIDIDAVQAVLAVQALDGWLLVDSKAQNHIARELVQPEGKPLRQWFFFIPATGQPVMLVHKSEISAFDAVAGRKLEYSGYRDLKDALRELLKGSATVAMEYAPESGIASLTRVDAGTVELVRKSGVTIRSSADLVQFTKSLWGPDGRVSHHLAVHHLAKLREEAFAFVAERIRASRPVTEHDVQVFLQEGARVRGLTGYQPVVASGTNTANPQYQATKSKSATIKEGDLLLISLSGAVADADRPIYASLSWVGYVGETVPERFHRVFAVVMAARDQAIELIRERVGRRRPVKGFEVDQKARNEVGKAGLAARFLHRTGHSLDTSLYGDGANLDDYETHDTRTLVVGSGFTVGPGVYMSGDFGIRTIAAVHLVQSGVEVTTPLQNRIEPILATP